MKKKQSHERRKTSKPYDKERHALLEKYPRGLQFADLILAIDSALSIVFDITMPVGHTGCHVKNAEELNTLLEWSTESRDNWDSHKTVAKAIWDTYPESFILVEVDPNTKEWVFKPAAPPHEKHVALVDVETLINAPIYTVWASAQFLREQVIKYVNASAESEDIAYFDHLGEHDDILLYVSKLKVICDTLLIPEGFFGRFSSVQEEMIIPMTLIEDYVRTAFGELPHAASRVAKKASSIMKWNPSRPLTNDVTHLTPYYVHADTVLHTLLFEIKDLNKLY